VFVLQRPTAATSASVSCEMGLGLLGLAYLTMAGTVDGPVFSNGGIAPVGEFRKLPFAINRRIYANSCPVGEINRHIKLPVKR
jgi:hypothetical protein